MKLHILQKLVSRYVPAFLAAALALAACGPVGSSATEIPTLTDFAPTTAPLETRPVVTATTEAVQQPSATTPPTSTAMAADTPAVAVPTATTAAAQNESGFPDPADFEWAPVATGIGRPTDLQPSPDGTGRLFVLAQRGVIRIIQDGALLPEPFLDIRDRIGITGNEQGLLGLAFHPEYASNGFFYLNYTDLNGDTVVARYSVSEANPNQADPNSEEILLQVDQPYPNHNGGGMVFGPDGYLYISLGDGGSAGDPQGNAQNVNNLLGKLLRIDVNNPGSDGRAYAIPPDNPFVDGGGAPEIWAYGLRNPWRFSFDRANGDLYIADVGQNAWEEIHYQPAGAPGGANYGWNYREGTHEYRGTPPPDVELIDPVFEYGHDQGCSVTGGYVYRGSRLPEFEGIYLFGDYCSGFIWGLMRDPSGAWQAQKLFETGLNLSSFGQDEQGEIYAVDQGNGGIYRLQRKGTAFIYLPVVEVTALAVPAETMPGWSRRLSA